jgi:hypothetical protein
MIVVDASETRSTSRLPEIEGAIVSNDLEAWTGADVLVSPLSLPVATLALVEKHIEAGAVLVQFKSGRDLVESVLHRNKVALARMHQVGASPWQCCILATGTFLPDIETGLVLAGRPNLHEDSRVTYSYMKTTVPYSAFATAKRRFFLRGGHIEVLPCEDEVTGWLLGLERDLVELSSKPVKQVYPEIEKFPPPDADPYQEVKEVKDARSVIAALQGVGPVLADRLYKTIGGWNEKNRPLDRGFSKKDWEPTLQQMVIWGTMWKPELYNLPKVSRWPRAGVRKQFGLYDGQEFTVQEIEVPQKASDK